MRAVVDSSVLVASLVDEDSAGHWARTFMSTCQMMAPDHVLVEACNALRRMAQDQATSEFHHLMLLDLELCRFKPLAQRIWELRGNLTSHDAWYVALAERLHCPLLTLDMRLGRAPGPLCDIITPQSGLPETVVHQSVSRTAPQ